MIKLTLNPDQKSKVITLDKEVVVIGHPNGENVDLPLDAPGIQQKHVVIEEQNDRFVVFNVANDPFTSLNGLPFGKKPLKNFDRIEIGEHTIQFEFVEEDSVPVQENDPEYSGKRPR